MEMKLEDKINKNLRLNLCGGMVQQGELNGQCVRRRWKGEDQCHQRGVP